MISTVRPGVISIWRDGAVDRRVFVAGGIAEVQPERCTVLAEDAVPLDDADEAEADRRIADAREALERATDEGAMPTQRASGWRRRRPCARRSPASATDRRPLTPPYLGLRRTRGAGNAVFLTEMAAFPVIRLTC